MNQREAKRKAHKMAGAILKDNLPPSSPTDSPDQQRITAALVEIVHYHAGNAPQPEPVHPDQMSLETQWS